MDDRPHLLFLAHLVPWPPDAGAPIRTWHLLKELAEGYRIDGIFLRRPEIPLREDALPHLATYCEPTIARVDARVSNRRSAAVLRGLVSGKPYTHYLNGSSEAVARLRQLLATDRHSLAHVDSLDLVAYLPVLQDGLRPGSASGSDKGLPIVLGHHSVESEMLERRGALESNPLMAMTMALQARLLRRTEREWCGKVALNVCVSERDAEKIRERASLARTSVAPNGVDVEYFRPASVDGGDEMVFIGGADWAPNLDAIRYFATEIGPAFGDRDDSFLTCIGRTTASTPHLNGVRWTGYVPDIRPHLARAAVVVVPLRVGGGTRLKILTAWAMGKPVVSTRLGAEGLDARPGENILIADEPREFAAAVSRVRTDPELAAKLAAQGRSTVERIYDWRIVGKHLRRTTEA